jgi:succinate dehydrogenase / fumarate reductase cytochrome b subunit
MAGNTAKLSIVLNSSIGKKVLMAASGLFLCIFLLEHLYTNILLFKPLIDPADGGQAFNQASHEMVHNILIRTVEFILFGAIIFHVVQAIRLTIDNKKARPVGYASGSKAKTSWISKNMGLTGSIILFFIVVHLYQFFLPYRVTGEVGGDTPYTLAYQVSQALTNPIYAALYLVSVILIGLHVSHGLQSGFQTIGLNNKKYAPVWKAIGYGYAVLITVGFASFPIFFYFNIMGIADKIQ